MNAETLKLILTAAGLVLALLTTIVTAIAKNSKSAKSARVANRLLAITTAAQNFVSQAELISGFTGENKKEWVMTKVNQFCISKGIIFQDKEVSDIIESLITFSKNVNANKAVKKEEEL